MTLYATRIHADTATVTVVSHDRGVASWAARYFGPWWYASGVEALGPDDSAEGDAVVFADVNPRLAGSIAELVAEDAHDETDYAGARTLVARRGSITYAVQPDEELAYQVDSRRLVVAGHQAEAVAVAAARLVRESVRGRLAQAGWTVLHASAATRDGQAVIALGGRGTGKDHDRRAAGAVRVGAAGQRPGVRPRRGRRQGRHPAVAVGRRRRTRPPGRPRPVRLGAGQAGREGSGSTRPSTPPSPAPWSTAAGSPCCGRAGGS